MDAEPSLRTAERDNDFYFESVTFLVERTLIKVPKRYFETRSTFFSDLFSLPVGDEPVEGTCDENPIKVEGVSKPDFKSLLTAMYPNLIGNSISAPPPDRDGWIAALKLSTMWGFQEIRELAIQGLSGLLDGFSILRISLGKEYRVQKWIREGCRELIQRDGKLSEAEAKELGFETAWRIGHLREETTLKCAHPDYGYGTSATGRDFSNLESLIGSVFDDQLKDAEYTVAGQ